MRIISTQPNYAQNSVFHGNSRTIYKEQGKIAYRTTTSFFREDMNWDKFVSFLIDKYKNVPKVNIIAHACSNGAEPYSLAIKLMERNCDPQKFFPILARDINPENIIAAKSGIIGIKNYELYKINAETKNNIGKYFKISKRFFTVDDIALKPKPNLKDKVEFIQADILKDIENVPKSNTVILCRNFWPYLAESKREFLAHKLSKLDKSSLVVFGSFDSSSDVYGLLSDAGFKETKVEYVFEKRRT